MLTLTWIIQISLISIIFIFLIHNIFCFLKNTLTIPKVHDLVNNSKKYENMYSIILNNTDRRNNLRLDTNTNTNTNTNVDLDSSCTAIDLLPNTNTNSNYISESNINMKNELKSFLKSQLADNSNKELESGSGSGSGSEVVEYENNSLLTESFSYL